MEKFFSVARPNESSLLTAEGLVERERKAWGVKEVSPPQRNC